MQVSWRREGLYIEAETDEERQFLVNCLESETLKPLIEASGEIDMHYGILGRPRGGPPEGKGWRCERYLSKGIIYLDPQKR